MTMRFRYALSILLLLAFAACADETGGDTGDAFADAMHAEHADDSTGATALVMEPMIPVEAREVTYGDGYSGYYAQPVRPDSVAEARGLDPAAALPAVIVVHEWWGLNDNIRTMARRLAGEGYQVLAVDLYGGEVATSADQARELVTAARQDEAGTIRHLTAAHDYLAQAQDAPRVGVMGWCFGGGVALQAALALPEQLGATVIYYGQLVTDPDRLAVLDMPILGLFGAEDTGIPADSARAFEAALDDLGKDADIHIYDGAGHAFANPTGDRFQEAAARDAWDRTTAFLREHLYE